MSHSSMVNELQCYAVLRKRVNDVVGIFMRESLNPSESIIRHLIEMEMDYINSSHPNFIGGYRALEMAQQQIRSSLIAVPVSGQRDGGESDTTRVSKKSLRSRANVRSLANGFIKPPANGVISDQVQLFTS